MFHDFDLATRGQLISVREIRFTVNITIHFEGVILRIGWKLSYGTGHLCRYK